MVIKFILGAHPTKIADSCKSMGKGPSVWSTASPPVRFIFNINIWSEIQSEQITKNAKDAMDSHAET